MRSLRAVTVLLCLALVGALAPALPAHAAVSQKGTYTPLTAARLLDTRTGNGAPKGQLGADKTLDLQISNRGGVPAAGVSAVVLNLTATQATANSYLAAYPTGKPRPVVSSINFSRGVPVANIATVPLGSGGKITLFNLTGSVSVLVDVMGFYTSSDTVPSGSKGPGNEFDVVAPERLVDTRTDPEGALAPQDVITSYVKFSGVGDSANVKAVALNITAVGAKGSGYLTAWNGVGKPPVTSTLNYQKNNAIANMAVVNTHCEDCTPGDDSSELQFGVYNGSSTSVEVLIDLVGLYFNNGSVALRFTPVAPVRISDSRKSLNGKPLTANQTQVLNAPGSVAGANTVALVANAAVVAPTASTYLTLWETGQSRPAASNLNASAGTTAANGVIAGLAVDNKFSLFNLAGTGHFLVDVTGRFDIGSGAGLAAQRVDPKDERSVAPTVTTRRTVAVR